MKKFRLAEFEMINGYTIYVNPAHVVAFSNLIDKDDKILDMTDLKMVGFIEGIPLKHTPSYVAAMLERVVNSPEQVIKTMKTLGQETEPYIDELMGAGHA